MATTHNTGTMSLPADLAVDHNDVDFTAPARTRYLARSVSRTATPAQILAAIIDESKKPIALVEVIPTSEPGGDMYLFYKDPADPVQPSQAFLYVKVVGDPDLVHAAELITLIDTTSPGTPDTIDWTDTSGTITSVIAAEVSTTEVPVPE